MSIRTLMIAVALAGCLLGVSLEIRRRSYLAHHYQRLATFEEAARTFDGDAAKARAARDRGEPFRPYPVGTPGPQSWSEQIQYLESAAQHERQQADHHRRMIQSYGG